MRLTILGSGGPLTTPRPGCPCRVCTAARRHGGRGRRGGPGIFVHDANLLIDATEDIVPLLNRAGVERIDHLFLTHWHPDHTAGFRFVEQVNFDVLRGAAGRRTMVWMNAATARRLADSWRFFEAVGYCRLNVVEPGTRVDLGSITATWFNYAPEGFLSGFVLDDGRARALLALDETKDLAGQVAADPLLQGHDLLVAECGWFERDPEGHILVRENSRLRAEEAGFERDTLPLIRAARARRTVLTHLMDLHGRTPEEFDALAARLAPLDVQFAYDGMVVDL
ncbi:MAG TPA: MBL fold metallo-hydrolase [Chloroflexota bacterium]|nr:MBL fold metallo-hydrolase [Chloroflexota bacterium]